MVIINIKKCFVNLASFKGYARMLLPIWGWKLGINSPKFLRSLGYHIGCLPIIDSIGRSLIEKCVYPLSQTSRKVDHQEFVDRLRGQPLQLLRPDHQTIDAVWVPGRDAQPNDASIIIFHGNLDILDHFFDYAEKFRNVGLNVLLITMGGYPNSCATPTTEFTTYMDARTAMRYLTDEKKVQENEVFAIGHSIGATLALQSGAKHVITDQGFTKLSDVVVNFVMKNSEIPYQSKIAQIVKGFCHAAFSKEGNLDGLNNLKKVKSLNSYLAMGTNDDFLMLAADNIKTDLMKTLQKTNFAKTLAEAFIEKHSGEKLQDVLITVNGKHGDHIIRHDHVMEKVTNHIFRVLRS